MEEREKLTIRDAENAQRGILALVSAYPDFPNGFKADNTTVKWNSIAHDKSIGLFPLQGAVYIGKYINGSYKAQMPFQIVFRSSPTSNKANIDAHQLLTDLACWMEDSVIEFKDTHMKLESINRTSPVFGEGQNEKTTDYAVNMQLKYFYEK